MDLSTVSQEILQAKRENWLKPGSRNQPIQHSNVKITDYNKNASKFYGATPLPSVPSSAGSQQNKAIESPQGVLSRDSNFVRNTAGFYGATPLQTPNPNNSAYQKNISKFYGVTPPSSSAKIVEKSQSYEEKFKEGSYNSRPISQNTEFNFNAQKFYLNTPSDSLGFKKNSKAFHGYERSPLASAGKSLIQ